MLGAKLCHSVVQVWILLAAGFVAGIGSLAPRGELFMRPGFEGFGLDRDGWVPTFGIDSWASVLCSLFSSKSDRPC